MKEQALTVDDCSGAKNARDKCQACSPGSGKHEEDDPLMRERNSRHRKSVKSTAESTVCRHESTGMRTPEEKRSFLRGKIFSPFPSDLFSLIH
jgi:hypothetical protein